MTTTASPHPATTTLARPLPAGQIAPSILAADFSQPGRQVAAVLGAGARLIHVDVMDGHFVPPITMGTIVLGAIAGQVHDAGADLLVAGSAVFGAADPAAAFRRLSGSISNPNHARSGPRTPG